jgi:uncharacterized protein (TIGR02145 family)
MRVLIWRECEWMLLIAAAVCVGLSAAGCGKKDAPATESAAAESFTDGRDGQTYKMVKIGDQTWMAANLNYRTESGSWCYNNSADSCAKYGRLYDWKTAKTVCPAGWKLPSRQGWDNLGQAVGGVMSIVNQDCVNWNGAGKKLKARSGWNENGNGTDDFGFLALPGGFRSSDDGFGYVGRDGGWWTSEEFGSGNAYGRGMGYGYDEVDEYFRNEGDGLSVRCLMDAPTTEKSETKVMMPDKKYIGTWRDAYNPPNDLTILEIDSTIKFELGVHRITTTIGTAKIENNKIIFVTDCHWNGTIVFNENGILLTVDKSGPELASGTEFNFTVRVDEKKLQRSVKYLWQGEGVNYICFDDGTAYQEIEDHEPDESDLIISGKINPENPGNIETNATYKEFPTHLLVNGNNNKWEFFNEFGQIDGGWKIFNHYRVYMLDQITNFEPETAKIPEKDIQAITKTFLIFIPPENGYEEWMSYKDARKKEFAARNIESVDAQKRYLSFTLHDGEKIIVDTKKKQHGTIPPSALVYRKGYIPILIISGEGGMGNIDFYLSNDPRPPFEHWNTLKDK